ncbi:hypothetical protein GCM10010424_53740 [Streptomyces lienomycini]
MTVIRLGRSVSRRARAAGVLVLFLVLVLVLVLRRLIPALPGWSV